MSFKELIFRVCLFWGFFVFFVNFFGASRLIRKQVGTIIKIIINIKKSILAIIFDIKIEIDEFEISNVPNFNKF